MVMHITISFYLQHIGSPFPVRGDVVHWDFTLRRVGIFASSNHIQGLSMRMLVAFRHLRPGIRRVRSRRNLHRRAVQQSAIVGGLRHGSSRHRSMRSGVSRMVPVPDGCRRIRMVPHLVRWTGRCTIRRWNRWRHRPLPLHPIRVLSMRGIMGRHIRLTRGRSPGGRMRQTLSVGCICAIALVGRVASERGRRKWSRHVSHRSHI